jgi:hypothetical protein
MGLDYHWAYHTHQRYDRYTSDGIFLFFNSQSAKTIHDGTGNEVLFFLLYVLNAGMPCCYGHYNGHYNGHYLVSHTKWQMMRFSFLLMRGITTLFFLLWSFVRALPWRVSAQQLAHQKGLGAPGVASAPKD